jgi:pantoate--beta-alanine ligase
MEMITTPRRESELDLVRATLTSPLIFIPTMGALHEGHATLIRHGASLAGSLIVSVFVNPLQFEDAADLEKYPKQIEADRAIALDAGADFLWAPSFDDIYPGEIERVPAGRIGSIFEGVSRPGHFDGMLTVVKLLFESVRPDIAIFGEKDFQQLFLVKRLANAMGIEIISHPTVRDERGLALSSRNTRLSPEGRESALIISRALNEAESATAPRARMHEILASESAFKLDYAEVIDEESFEIIDDGDLDPRRNRRALIAGWVEGVRLIDNMAIGGRE